MACIAVAVSQKHIFEDMNTSRREFLSGAAAFGLGGWRLFAAPSGWKHGGKPNLVFGVVSDTHIRTDWSGEKPSWRFPIKYFRSALEYFKAANVDAVVHCGDFAHRGMAASIQFHADAWREVFGKHGGPVKLFVSGNHDIIGGNYGNFASQLFKDETLRNEHLFCHDSAAKWEKIWGEPYEPLWHKEVKGYHFFGRQWETKDEMSMAQFVEERAKKYQLDGKKPFFCLQHRGPGRKLCARLNKRPNVVCFFGHAHNTAANWNNVLVREGCSLVSIPSCEPRGALTFWSDKYIAKAALAKHAAVGGGRQGYVVRVYDDILTIERREFGAGGTLGPDWVMPLGKYDPHPFSKEELKKVIGEPQFGKSVKLKVEIAKSEVGEDVARILIPLADGNPDSRVYAYEVVVAGDEGMRKLHKAVYAAGCNMGIGHEPNGGVTTLDIPKSELPPGKTLTIAVRPLTSLGTFGKAIATTFKS